MAKMQKTKVKSKAVKGAKVALSAHISKSATASKSAASKKSVSAKIVSKIVVKAKAAPAKAAKSVKPAAPHKAAAVKAAAVKPVAAAKKPAAKAHAPAAAVAQKPAPGKAGPATVHQIAKAHAAHTAKAQQAQRAVTAAVAKVPGQKISAPAPMARKPAPAQAVSSPKEIAEKAAAARVMLAAQNKPVSARHGFKTNEYVVYPAHGVGRIVGIEEQEIAGMSLELFVITFDKEKLTLRVPTGKLASVGMRKLAEDATVKRAMETLKGRARVKRQMWSRRAQEYVAKINSGDLISIAEVVRDLYRSEAQPEQSYSERQLYEDALERMARELAAVERLDERGAVQRIVEILSKSAKGRRLASEAEAAGEANGDVKAA